MKRPYLSMSLVVIAALVSNCTGASSSNGDEQSGDAQQDIPAEIRDAQSPISAVLGEPALGTERDTFQATEAMVQACMRTLGFTYEPRTPPPGEVPIETETSDLDGYGITTQLFEQTYEVLDPEEAAQQDPNAKALDAMTQSERDAWNLALWGRSSSAILGTQPDTAAPGCYQEAQDRILDSPRYSSWYDDAYDEMYERLVSDTRWQDLDRQWSRCMKEVGYDFATPGDLFSSLEDLVQPFYAISSEFSIDEEVTLTPEQRAALTEAQTYERDLAAADRICAEPLDDERQELTKQYELHFVEQYYSQLTATD